MDCIEYGEAGEVEMDALEKFERALDELMSVEHEEIDEEFQVRVRRAINRLIKFKNNVKFVLDA